MNQIYGSTLDASNHSSVIQSNISYIEQLTDGIATLNSTGLSGLISPTSLGDAVNKSYADNYIFLNPGSTVAGPSGSIQYNNGGVFAGSSNLTWTSTTNILNANALTDGILNWTGTSITNLVSPEDDLDIANRNYVNTHDNAIRSTVNLNQNVTYTAAQTVNGVITRNGFNSTLVDLTPTAHDIITTIKGSNLNSTAYLCVTNETTSDSSLVLIVPNLGVNIYSTRTSSTSNTYEKQLFIALYKGYRVVIKMVITNIDTTNLSVTNLSTDAVSFLIERVSINDSVIDYDTGSQYITNQFQILNNNSYFINSLQVRSNFMSRFNPTTISTDANVTYSVDTILNYLIIRSGLSANRTDSLVSAGNLTAIVPYPFQPNNNSINENSGITFCVKNNDPTYNIVINLSSTGYTADYLSPSSTIAPGKTGISFSRTSSVNTVWLYVIGII
jgi:hypothetical protein